MPQFFFVSPRGAVLSNNIKSTGQSKCAVLLRRGHMRRVSVVGLSKWYSSWASSSGASAAILGANRPRNKRDRGVANTNLDYGHRIRVSIWTRHIFCNQPTATNQEAEKNVPAQDRPTASRFFFLNSKGIFKKTDPV
jgi:hypothetical protein